MIFPTMLPPGDEDVLKISKSMRGVVKIPSKLPRTDAQIARGVLPPTVRVKITAELTGGGNAPTTSRPFNTRPFIPTVCWRIDVSTTTKNGTANKLNPRT